MFNTLNPFFIAEAANNSFIPCLLDIVNKKGRHFLNYFRLKSAYILKNTIQSVYNLTLTTVYIDMLNVYAFDVMKYRHSLAKNGYLLASLFIKKFQINYKLSIIEVNNV